MICCELFEFVLHEPHSEERYQGQLEVNMWQKRSNNIYKQLQSELIPQSIEILYILA